MDAGTLISGAISAGSWIWGLIQDRRTAQLREIAVKAQRELLARQARNEAERIRRENAIDEKYARDITDPDRDSVRRALRRNFGL